MQVDQILAARPYHAPSSCPPPQAMLHRQGAASGYAERENIDLRHKLSSLERKVAVDGTGPAKGRKRRLADQAKGT